MARPSNASSASSLSYSSSSPNGASVQPILQSRLANLFADITNFLAFKDKKLEQIATSRREALIARANRLIAKLDTYSDDDDIVDQLDRKTLDEIRDKRSRLELRANNLALLSEKAEEALKEENEEKQAAEQVPSANQTITPPPELPKFYGEPYVFPVFFFAMQDIVMSDTTLDDRAKYRKIYFSLCAKDQQLLAQFIDPAKPDLPLMLNFLYYRYQTWFEAPGLLRNNNNNSRANGDAETAQQIKTEPNK